MERWRDLCKLDEALLVEDSPWAYFQRHVQHLPAATRSQCQAELATLTLPHLTLVLHTSGVAVGRRHPTAHERPEEYSPVALQQMQALQHLQAPTFHVDATPKPPELAKRVKRLLGSKVFRVLTTTMEGMEHLLPGKEQLSREAAEQLARKLQLRAYQLDEAGVARLSRVAAVLKENPDIVNTQLAMSDARHYYQVIHDHVEVFALDLADLEQPADTPPFQIHTFGPPAYK